MFPTLLLGLQDLKNLRSQLYSAAEYFELSYTNDDQKQLYAYFYFIYLIWLSYEQDGVCMILSNSKFQ